MTKQEDKPKGQPFEVGTSRKLRRPKTAMDGSTEIGEDVVVTITAVRSRKGQQGPTWAYVLEKVGNRAGDLSGMLDMTHWVVKHDTRAVAT